MRRAPFLCLVLLGAAFLVAGCGSKKESASEPADTAVQAACTGSQLTGALKLPPSFPQIEAEKVTYTQQRSEGPTDIVEGYFNGSVADAHDEYKKELQAAGYKILFDELGLHGHRNARRRHPRGDARPRRDLRARRKRRSGWAGRKRRPQGWARQGHPQRW